MLLLFKEPGIAVEILLPILHMTEQGNGQIRRMKFENIVELLSQPCGLNLLGIYSNVWFFLFCFFKCMLFLFKFDSEFL